MWVSYMYFTHLGKGFGHCLSSTNQSFDSDMHMLKKRGGGEGSKRHSTRKHGATKARVAFQVLK